MQGIDETTEILFRKVTLPKEGKPLKEQSHDIFHLEFFNQDLKTRDWEILNILTFDFNPIETDFFFFLLEFPLEISRLRGQIYQGTRA